MGAAGTMVPAAMGDYLGVFKMPHRYGIRLSLSRDKR